MKKVRLSVEGLHCKTCAEHLTRVVSLIKGVHRVVVDIEHQLFEGSYDDDHVSHDRLRREITALGWKVFPV